MNEQMKFPETFEEFAKEYGFKDDKKVYTNGSDLIPIFRVKQWLEHNDKSPEKHKEPKLKPCPFCGSGVEISRVSLWGGSRVYPDCYTFRVVCNRCGCTVDYPDVDTADHTVEDAINMVVNAWNQRNKE